MTLEFAARHTCDSPEWYTPSPFVEAAREVMGEIDLDPASHEEANRIVKAAYYFSADDDGLSRRWWSRVFLNPPGGLVAEFWRRLIEEHYLANVQQAVWIGYSLEQLQTLQCVKAFKTPMDFPICITSKRIAFVENQAKQVARLAKIAAEGEKPGASKEKQKAAAAIRAGKIPASSPSHSNYVTYIGPHTARFAEVFSKFGQVRL